MTVTNIPSDRSSTQQPASAGIVLEHHEPKSIIRSPALAQQEASVQEFNRMNSQSTDATACSVQANKLEGRVDSFDHVTFWVGNAKQSAVFYMTQFGFQPFAFRGLETGSRDLACHVVKLNDTIIQFVSAVEPNNEKLNKFLLSHGDAVKDVAFRVENIEFLLKHALEQGAELVNPLEVITVDHGVEDNTMESLSSLGKLVVKRATIKAFGDVTHTFIERNYDYEKSKFLPGYKKPSLEVSNVVSPLLTDSYYDSFNMLL